VAMTELQRFQDLLTTMHESWVVGLRKQMGLTTDWAYRDVPWTLVEYFDQLFEAIGFDNYRTVSNTTMTADKKNYVRGSYFINTAGLKGVQRLCDEITAEKMPSPEEKPFMGTIKNWWKVPCRSGLGYLIRGRFDGHPQFDGELGHTSYVVAHDEEASTIETRNSRYKLKDPLTIE
jgi:hypothetical protein